MLSRTFKSGIKSNRGGVKRKVDVDMNEKRKQWGMILGCILLSSCAQYEQKKDTYIKWKQGYHASTSMAPLRIPQGFTAPDTIAVFPTPGKIEGEGKPVSLAPPGFGEIDPN